MKISEPGGFETANIHLGSKTAMKALRIDLAKRKDGWLHAAGKKMAQSVLEDYEEWCKTKPKNDPEFAD